MAVENLLNLREKMNGLLAQGLQIASPEKLDTLVQDLSALHLEQPAALLKQVQQNAARRSPL